MYPSGTVAFLFTDIEGSTARWEHAASAMWQAVERHFDLLRQAIAPEGGVLFKTVGDAVQAAFPSVPAAVRAAIAAQHALHGADFAAVGDITVRMAIHAGEATPIDGDYLAPVLNRLARVLNAGYGEQILLTEAARALTASDLPAGYAPRDLGAHRLKDLLVAERIYQLTGPGLRDHFPPLKSLDLRPHNLPAQPTEFIGRESETERLCALLTAPGTHLVTLTGPGGTGKSRLAVQAAADVLEDFTDGVWWVPLAAVSDPALVLEAIAAPLGLREQPGQRLLDTLAEHLRSRKTLLVLDNLEQVLTAAPILAQLLEVAPELVILATSREPLRLRGEQEIPVAPLSLPPPEARLTVQDALAFPAVRLFVERAQAVKPGFALNAENAAAVAAICRQLDGLPLAIELAAARVRLLPPAALLARLEKRLSLLTGGARDLPERQQTLRAAIAWSHDMLAPMERTLFARLAVFAGGCTLEAAESVADTGAGTAIDLFDGIEGLVQKSLLRQSADPEDEPRFTMLETIREFALEQLAADRAEEEAIRSAHAAYFRHVVELATGSEDQASSYGNLEVESGNVRAALDWLERADDPTASLEFVTKLRWFWWVRGHLREGQTQFESALRRAAAAPPELRASALSGLGALLEASGAYERADEYYKQALVLYREAADQEGIAEALDNLGEIATLHGDFPRSTALREEALALRRELGDQRGIAVSLNNLGQIAALEHDPDRAVQLFTEAHELSLETGDQWILGISLGNLGGAMLLQSRDSAGTPRPEATVDEARAAALTRDALAIWRDLGDRAGVMDVLLTLATIATPADPRRTALLLGAAEAIAAETGYQLSPTDPEQHQHLLAEARSTLGGEAFEAAHQRGQRLTLMEAIAAALETG